MTEFNLPKIAVPKVDFQKFDIRKISLRRLNWNTVLGILAYLHILVFIPALVNLRKKSPYLSFHTGQGIKLLVLWVLFPFSFYLPVLPWIAAVFIVICLLIGIINAVTGRERPLPIIGRFQKL